MFIRCHAEEVMNGCHIGPLVNTMSIHIRLIYQFAIKSNLYQVNKQNRGKRGGEFSKPSFEISAEISLIVALPHCP